MSHVILTGVSRRSFRLLIACVFSTIYLAHAAPVQAQEPNGKVISKVTGVAGDPAWAEEYAYTLGVQAYTFAFPWYYNQLLRWLWISQPPRNERTPSMPMNTLWHSRKLIDASYRDGGSPNNDALYSVAWVDVSREPVIVSVPEIRDRYYSVHLTGYDADTFDYIGTRTTGAEAGDYLIAGPGWNGTPPAGVKAVKPASTPIFLLLIRTMIEGPQELDTVHAIQDRFQLKSLSRWGEFTTRVLQDHKVWAPYNSSEDPLADWKTINRAMTENPPPPGREALVDLFAKIGIGPGQDVEQVDEATRRGLLRALETGRRVVTGAATFAASSTLHNGWSYFSHAHGVYGLDNDYTARAGVASLAGIATMEEVEAMYPMAVFDVAGERLTGTRKYTLRFAGDEMPPVDAFWSITAYGEDFTMIPNPLDRYSLGDRSQLKRDADGGLTLYVQKDSPGDAYKSNWLPVAEQDFTLILRLYLPKREALEREWLAPALQQVN